MRTQMKCVRCNGTMEFMMQKELQLGKAGWILGDLPNLLAGALSVDIYCCRNCGKLEFFRAEAEEETYGGDRIAQRTCPKCGNVHDIDYPKCPFCKYSYD